MAKWSGAIWQPCKNFSGTLRPIAVCLHHQAGSGNPINVYNSRGVSAHFWIPKVGQPYQHVDTANQAWHGIAHNAYSIGVETEGCGAAPHAEPLTENQLAQFAALMQWANTTHGIPLVLSEAVTTPGFNYHRCQGGPATGCPCDVRKNSRTEILNRAKGLPPNTPPPAPSPSPGGTAPPFPGTLLINFTTGCGVATWQAQMQARGWSITVDDMYGNDSQSICAQFQTEKGLSVDGIVGPETWAAAWNAPVT
jgi:N-acetyl-anhydromuramyl-L-alanine amidase AmpD